MIENKLAVEQKFLVGTVFQPIGKRYKAKVIDFHVTRNLAGEVVKVRYVAVHDISGRVVTDYDVAETTIARGLAATQSVT